LRVESSELRVKTRSDGFDVETEGLTLNPQLSTLNAQMGEPNE
jgi:hypothetical protein